MSLTTFAIGDDFLRDENRKTKYPKSGYTPVVGHAVVYDSSVADGVDLAAANENPAGIVTWISVDATYMTVAEFVPGTTCIFPISGTVNLGDKIECTGSTAAVGTNGPTRSEIRTDNSNGIGFVIGTGSTSPAGTGTAVVRFGVN
jgi:hypothetical protein